MALTTLPSGAMVCADESKIAMIEKIEYDDRKLLKITYLSGANITLFDDDVEAFRAALKDAAKPEPMARICAPLDNPKVGDTVYRIEDLRQGKTIPYAILELDLEEQMLWFCKDGVEYVSHFENWTAIPL